MRAIDCATCYAAAERSGELALQLRRTAARLHAALGHMTHTVATCREPVCIDNYAVIEGRKKWETGKR